MDYLYSLSELPHHTSALFQVEEVIHTRGCLTVLGGALQRASNTLGVLSVGSAFVVLLSFILTIVLLKIMNEEPKPLRIQNYLVGMRHNLLNDEDLYPVSLQPVIDPNAKASVEDLKFMF
ncbi:hypothetical protein AVEN_82818-1 [Araneus ventricosus]|uniref:Uncharacterized protein n=1 Tax=Araneus ventricosus TaxID=182803 RepID=A0A4Y2F695_ARAVE|nr:hypothetical protein AVEN_82818-1 [Araneus ventricosus]